MAPGVVVLGMHRSGTSAVSRVVNLLGADVGPEEDLLVEYDNPSGHWENRSLIASNDAILAAFGRSWDFPPWFSDGWEMSPRASSLVPAMKEAFSNVYRDGPWVWKDPRTSLTLPLWRRVLGSDIVIVLVLRSPGSVVGSLKRRDGIPFFYGAGLWMHYSRSAVSSARGLRVICRRFEDMVSSPLSFVSRLVDDLAELGLPLSGDVSAAAASVQREPVAASITTRDAAPSNKALIVERLTGPTRRILETLPPTSHEFVPPSWREPRWVRPALTAYRAQWVMRARAGRPLRPGVT